MFDDDFDEFRNIGHEHNLCYSNELISVELYVAICFSIIMRWENIKRPRIGEKTKLKIQKKNFPFLFYEAADEW
jgi:hypothetical protein